jgi:hypothetical protein
VGWAGTALALSAAALALAKAWAYPVIARSGPARRRAARMWDVRA